MNKTKQNQVERGRIAQILVVGALLLGLLLYRQMPGVAAQDGEKPGADNAAKSGKLTAEEVEQIKEDVSTPGYWKELKRRKFSRIEEIYGGMISAHVEGRVMPEHIARMNSLMAQWNPIRNSKAELKSIIGDPTEIDDGKLIYRFDTGRAGSTWIFHMRDTTVVGVDHKPIR